MEKKFFLSSLRHVSSCLGALLMHDVVCTWNLARRLVFPSRQLTKTLWNLSETIACMYIYIYIFHILSWAMNYMSYWTPNLSVWVHMVDWSSNWIPRGFLGLAIAWSGAPFSRGNDDLTWRVVHPFHWNHKYVVLCLGVFHGSIMPLLLPFFLANNNWNIHIFNGKQ